MRMEQVGSFHGPVDASKQGHGLVAALCGAQPSSSSLCHGTHPARGVPELLALTHPVSGYPTKPRPSFHGFQLGVSMSFMPTGTFCFPCSGHELGFLVRETSLCHQYWGAVTPSSYWDAPAWGWLCRSVGHQRTGSGERNREESEGERRAGPWGEGAGALSSQHGQEN